MKTIRFTAILLLLLLCFTLCGCGEQSDSSVISSENFASSLVPQREKFIFKNELDRVIDLNDICVSIDVYGNDFEVYSYVGDKFSFTNRNEEFYASFLRFLSAAELTYRTGSVSLKENTIRLHLEDTEGTTYITISTLDEIKIEDYGASYEEEFFCEGIYKSAIAMLSPYVDDISKYCQIAETPLFDYYEYIIFNNNGDAIKSDTISRPPTVFIDNKNNVAHFLVPWGTGEATTETVFYDLDKGTASPQYYGLTDYYGSLVLSTTRKFTELSDGIYIYDMFSGKLLYTIDEFELPFYDSIESIVSAYFSPDGKQIHVTYYTGTGDEIERVKQSFALPQKVIDKR